MVQMRYNKNEHKTMTQTKKSIHKFTLNVIGTDERKQPTKWQF